MNSAGIKDVIDCKIERSGKLQNYGFVFVIVLLWIIRYGMHVRGFAVFVGKSLMSLNIRHKKAVVVVSMDEACQIVGAFNTGFCGLWYFKLLLRV